MTETKKFVTIHRLVALTFLPNPDNKRTVNHKDGNKLNNHVSNLEWATYQENNKHAISTGLRTSIRKVKCLETGVIYESCAAGLDLGLYPDTIKRSIEHHYMLDNGLSFVFLDDDSITDEVVYRDALILNNHSIKNHSKRRIHVVCLDTGDEFDSLTDAGKWAGTSYSAISEAISNKVACKGHVFVDAEDTLANKQKYIDFCYTNSRLYKHLASEPVYEL